MYPIAKTFWHYKSALSVAGFLLFDSLTVESDVSFLAINDTSIVDISIKNQYTLRMDSLNPQHTIFYTIEKAIKSYRKFAQKNLSEIVKGITIDQVLVLTVIESDPEVTQHEIASLLFKDFASITRMIELLVKNEFLSRSINETDRRKFKLTISPKGQSTLKQLKPIIFNNRNDALQGVSENEVIQLFNTLTKIINNC